MQKNYDLLTKTTRKPQLSGARCAGHRVLKPLQNAKPFRWLTAILTLTLFLLMGQTWAQTTQHTATFSNNQWTVPANTGRIIIDCWGGGGGGANSTGSDDGQQGGGGGGGGFARSMYDVTATSTVKAGDVIRRVVGAPANAGVAGNASTVYLGTTGTNELLSATGGKQGTTSDGGQGGQGSDGNVVNKTGGQGGQGYYNYYYIGTTRRGGGGGGAAGYTGSILEPEFMDGGVGLAGSNNTPSGGDGYTAIGCGNENTGNGGAGRSGNSGNAGTNYGGGGGGGAYTGRANSNGGTGAAGYVQVTYFIKYTITLNANGGTLIGESTIGVWENEAYGSALNANVPFYPGHIFNGWFTTGGTPVSSTDVPTTNTTLVAHWTEGTAPISLADQVTFPSSTTWIAPEGTWKITSIEAWGGGGGGGNATRSGRFGSGGGSGSYSFNEILDPQNFHNGTFVVDVAEQVSGGEDGKPSSVKYNGDNGTIYVNAGGGGKGQTAERYETGTGGAAGRATSGTTNENGNVGGDKTYGNRMAGNGAQGAHNGGLGGAGATSDGNGQPGNEPGGSGGGAFNRNGGSYYGGAGAAGLVKIAYEIRRLNVSFVDNYEGGSIKDTIILYYDTITYSPVREGYVFLGWYNQATGGAKFDFPTSGDYLLYNLTEDDTLYAHWLFPGAISSAPQTLRPCVAGGLTIASASEPESSPFTYQWRYSYNGAEEVVESGETEKDLTMDVPSTVGTYVYKRYVSIDGGTSWYQSANSCTVTVVERNAGKISLATAAEIFPCGSYTINNNVEADDVNTYQWRYVDAQGEHTVAEATGSSLTNAPNFTATGTYKFTRYIVSTCGGYLPSDTVTITVNPIPNGTIAANPTTIVSRNTYAITGSDAGSQFTYHWAYKKPGESNYTEISGATGKDLSNAPVLSAPGNYEFIRYTSISGCDCQAGTTTCNIEVQLEGGNVCFENPGDTTWSAPEGTYRITSIEAWGAGGAGGGSAYSTQHYCGSGGGSGAYSKNNILTSSNFHGIGLSIQIGSGGTCTGDAVGGNGEDSYVKFDGTTYVFAGGGKGGSNLGGRNTNTLGGDGGTASYGTINTSGNKGGNTANNYTSGKGADAPNNGGTGGAGRGQRDDGEGYDGTAPGGGGGGGRSANDGTAYIGGAGGDGQVCISYEILELQLITNNNYDNAQPDTILILYYDTLPANPTREGYVFAGWYDAPTGGNLVTFDSTGNYALYNHTEDLSLYAQWAVDAGSIATNTGAQRICKKGNYAIAGSTVSVPNVTYSWNYTLYKSNGTSSSNVLSVNQPSLSPDYFVLEEPGLYEFTRFVDAADDNFGPQTSANTFKINVVKPDTVIEGLDVNYPQICDGGKVELTPNMELANITLPVFDDPSRDTTIEAESVSYQYSINGGTSWNTYQNNITALAAGTPSMRAVFSYENLEGCYAYSEPIDVTVLSDPQFITKVITSEDSICPDGMITLTAGELSDPGITNNEPYYYTWKVLYGEEEDFIDLGAESTYSYGQNGKEASVSNFQVTGDIYYIALAENALGCNAQSNEVEYEDDEEEMGGYGYVNVEDALPPVVSKMVTCPNPSETFVFENNVTADYELVWYANISTMNSEDEIPEQSLANEDTVVWYVAQNYGSCISARVPDTLVIRYTSHIAQTSESSTLQQEVCQFTDITPITFQFDGNAYPEYTGTLPAGVKAVIDTNTQTYTISGTPTVDGNFDFTVKLQDGPNPGDCSQPTVYEGAITVHPSPHTMVYFTSCDHEEVTIGTGAEAQTFNTPGTYTVPLHSSSSCDSIVTLIYTETFFNKFGYYENEELLAGWTNFGNVPAKTGTINSDITSVYGGTISYSGWKGSNIKCGNLTSSSSFINASGNSLGLVNGSSGDDLNNGKSIILKTSTKGYDDVNLHFDYGAERYHWTAFVEVWSTTDIAFSTISFAYSFDGENYETVPDQLVVYFGEQELTTGSYGLNFKELLPNNVLANKNDVYVKITFDGASRSSEFISSQYFRLDNIAFTGVKAIDTIGILIAGGDDTVCTNSEVNLTATPPYIQLDDYDVPIDTMEITYTWERIYNGVSDTVQLGATYDDHVLVDAETDLEQGLYKYVVSVGKGECLLSDTMDVYRLKPIYNEDDTVRGVVCSNRINNITDIQFLNDFVYQEGMAIVETSMDDLAVPGLHYCKLSIPRDDNKCGEVRTLELNVKRAFDTTIVENICLGETYNKYGIEFTPEVEGITYRQSDFTCANGCDSIYRVTLITNSVEASLTDQYDITLAEWDMAKGRNNFRPTNGTRTQNATFMVNTPGNAPSFENVNGHTPSEDYSYREGNGALMWPNLFSTCSAAGTAASATEYQGVYFEIALNPKDYTNLKAKFDYKRENETSTNSQAFDNVNYSYKIGEGGTYSTPQSKTISGTDWSTDTFDFSGADTQDEDIIYLKFEFTGGNKGASEYCGSGLAALVSGSRYLPSYITIDNMKVWGDKPARATLAANPTATYIPTGSDAQTTVAEKNEISICRDAEVTFTIQQADDAYFTFYVQDPEGVDSAFNGLTTMTLAPQTTGDYFIVAHDNITGCDSLYTFPVVVNEYAEIADCMAPYICSGAPLAFAPSDAPENTTYSWNAPTSRHIDFNTLKPGANQDSLRAALSSDTTSIISVDYNLTPSTGGCVGSPFKVTVNVLPEVTSLVTKPTDLEGCHGTEKECAILFSNIKSTVSRQVVWEFNGASEAVPNSSTGTTMEVTRTVSLPDTPCDTTYKLYATYTDGAGCIAKDSIALKVDIPAHSFEIAGADAGSIVYCLTDASEPASALVPKAYSGCGDTLTGVFVGTYVDSPTTITCSGTRTYTYKYTDCKGQDTTWDYVYTISHKAPEMKQDSEWPADSVNQPKVFAQADTSCLYNDAQVKALYQDNCGGANFTVTHVQVDSSTANSGWKITRTYTIANSCGDTVMPKPTMSVSGNDQTPPTYTRPADTVAYLAIDGTVLSDTSKTGAPTNVTDDSGNKCDTTYRDEPYTYACGVSFNRIWRVTDACGNVSLSDSVQKITVKDTLTPRIADNGKLKDTTVYLTAYNACGYTLPDTLKTVVQVNTLKEGFIKGQNLKPAITMTQDTTNKDGCGMFITRTYTVTDTCSHNSATFTHKIFVADTTKPVLAGSWPDNITKQNHIYAEADTSGLKSDDYIKALFNDCHDNITVTHTQAPTFVSNCGWTIVRTYHIEDACHNGFDSTMSVSGANQNAPMRLADTWPTGASNVNTCLTNPDTSSLKADTAIAKLFSDTCGVYVTHKDSVVVGSTDCNWTIIRTYSIKDSCENEVTPAPFMTVTGGDTSKPVFTCPADLTLYRTADCTYDADTATTHSVPTAISDNCTEPDNLTVVFSDDTVAGACSAAITIKRTWSVTDACENVGQKVQVITILDTITPKMYADSIWIAELDTQKNCARSADTTVFYTDAQVKAKFYDNCSNAVIVTHTQNFEEDGQCFWNAIRTYTISDSCGNTTTRTQKLPGSAINDPLAPTLISENTWPENVTGNDNCFANADTSLLYNDDEVAALFEDQCSVVILVSHEDDTLASADNGWEILRTYTIKDGCGNTVYFDESLPTMSLSGADSTAPVLSGAWPHDITGITACPSAVEDTSALLTDDIVKEMFSDCCAITVTHENETFDVEEVNCGWEVRRTYTITDACNNSTDTTISIFGTMEGEGSAPTRNGSAWPEDITGQNNCFANADTTGLYSNAQIAALFTNECSGVVVTHVDDITSQTSNCGWTITRTYTVKDVCGNQAEGPFTMSVSGSDQTAPALTGTWPKDSSNINKSVADIPAGPTKAAIKALFTDCADVTVDSVRNVTGTDCDWTAKFCYQIKDECGNTVKDTVTYTGGDNEKPKFVCPKDTTLNLTEDGTVDASPENTGKPTEVSDNYTLEANMNIYHIDKDTTVNCGNTFYFTREWHVADTCGNDSVKTQKITVADTMKPVIKCKDVAQSSYTNVDSDTYTIDTDTWNVTASDNNAIDTIYYHLFGATNGEGANTLNGVTFNTGMTLVTWTVKDVCGNDTTCTDTIKIINANPITVYISENTDTVVYDGQEHTLTGYVVDSISNNLYTVADFKLKESAINDTIVKGTLVDSYSMNLNQDDFKNVSPYFNNIHFNVTSRDLVIKQNPATITIASGSHTFDASEYDGQPHYFPSYVVKYNGVEMPRTAQDSTKFVLTTGDTLAVTAVGSVTSAADNRDKNNTFTWILQNANCYANEIDTNGLVGTIRFNAFPQTIQIASFGKTWTYDGNAHSYPKYTVKFGDDYATCFADDTTKFILPISGDTVRIQSTASITNVGKVANTFTYTIDHEEMYVGSRDTIIDTLRMIPLTGVEVTIVERTDTATYNGAMHYVTGYDVANISSTLYSASYFSYNGGVFHKTAAGRYAGTYPMGVLSTDFVNMNTNFDGVIFTIVDRDLVVKPIQSNIQITANSAEKNYDGTQLTNNGFTFTTDVALVAGDTIVALVTGSQTEVGSSANVVEEYHIWRKKSFNVDMLAASMSMPDAYDDVTNCYTFADPATVNGILLVNQEFAVSSVDSTDVVCFGEHNGTATIVVGGGKKNEGQYAYEVSGPNSYAATGNIETRLELTGLYPGAYTVTFTDALDSTATATFNIHQPDTMVAEIIAPEELCPNQGSYPVSVTVTGGNGTNAYVWGSNATNVDAASTVVAQIGASDCDHEYTAAVQVTDAKGCVAKDTVKFTVVDNEAPVFTVPGDITICRNADGQIDAPTSVTGVPSNYSDNCSNEATLIRHTQWVDLDTTGNVNTLMVIRRQWTVTDSCDNSTVKVQNITVKPGIGVAGSNYVLTAPENIEITLKYGQVDTLLTNIGSAVASNLPTGIDAPVVTDNRPANNRYNEGTTVVIWTATDECGFTVTATQTIVVNYPLCEPVTYEGYVYPAVRVGGNCWLAENLHNTKYADGADVPEYSSYNNDGNMTDDYGLLYSWYSAVRVSENDDNATPTATIDGYIQGLCPENWAIPTQAEYNNLFETAGTTGVLKDLNAQFWLPGAAGTTPNTGFNARGTGFYDSSIDRYMNLLGEAYFWTSDLGATVTQGKCSVITHFCPELINQNQDKGMGFSVRCVRKK